MPGPYPIRVVSRLTGLSVDTLRAWERRYAVVTPVRSARGRLYDDADVQRFLQLKAAVNNGYAIGQVAALSTDALNAIEATEAARPRQTADAPPAHLEAVIDAISSFDNSRLSDELGRLATLLSPAEFVHQVALPLMREVGERWHNGTMTAAHEHMATENIRGLLGAMLRLNRASVTHTRLLAGTPAGEFHETGILASAVLASARGFDVTRLGPNLPAKEILYAAEKIEAEVLLLGLTTPEPLAVTLEAVHTIADGLPPETELWLGGVGARTAFPDPTRPGLVFLDDFSVLEANLTRLQSRNNSRRVA